MMPFRSDGRRLAFLVFAIGSGLVLTAQVALAGSGTGRIRFPNPLAPLMPGNTERSLIELGCTQAPPPDIQGYDAWVAGPLEDNFLVVRADRMPKTPVGSTFFVVFYSKGSKGEGSTKQPACHREHIRVPLGNPTQPIWIGPAHWAVINVLAGVDVDITWKECASSTCAFNY